MRMIRTVCFSSFSGSMRSIALTSSSAFSIAAWATAGDSALWQRNRVWIKLTERRDP